MEKMISYFKEKPEELQQILEGKASFVYNFSSNEVFQIITEVLNSNFFTFTAGYWK